MTHISKMVTFTGVPCEQIPEKLAVLFEDERAYKPVPGGATLTDINTGFMLERVTEVFGPKGAGWNLSFKPESMQILNPGEKRVTAHLTYALFSYLLWDPANPDGDPLRIMIETSGVSANQIEYAPEGARTNALGAALKGLCFQSAIYKGLRDKPRAAKQQQPRGEGASGATGSQERPPYAEYIGKKIALVSARLKIDREDAKAFVKDVLKAHNVAYDTILSRVEELDAVFEKEIGKQERSATAE